MGAHLLRCLAFFFLCIFLAAGSRDSEKPPLEAILRNQKSDNIKKRISISSSTSLFTTQLDTTTGIPIINPTTPSSTPPPITMNPITTPTSPPTMMNPIISPPPPAMTSPIITPITPTTPTIPSTPTTPTTPTTTTPTSSSNAWCIANPTASETALQVALDYACGYGGADCAALQPSGSCYNPNTIRDHASYAFNSYYQKNPSPTSCVFGGTAQLTYTDPSSGSCHYASSTTSTTPPSITPPSTPTSYTPTPPNLTSPGISTTTPNGSTEYDGTEPTGTPSSAHTMSCNSMLLFTTTGLLASLFAAKHY